MTKEFIIKVTDSVWPDEIHRFEEEYAPEQELIRCKDCKWYQEGYDIDGKWFTRCNGSVRTYGHTRPDWFCADAERAT